MMRIVNLDKVDSTNTWAKTHVSALDHLDLVVAENQTSGRGQRGNRWESEPGKNLSVTGVCKGINVPASSQFSVSEAVALAVVDVLSAYGILARVKWPNDIYVGDKKICGILIEHSVRGSELEWSILGIGINVNQEKFLSDAPNPVSMRILTSESYDLKEMLDVLSEKLEYRIAMASSIEGRATLHAEFLEYLWRGDEKKYPFRDTATDEIFMASISEIEPMGFLILESESGLRRYAFKEVEFII